MKQKNPEAKSSRYDWGWMLNKVQSLTRKRRKRRVDKQRRQSERKDNEVRISEM